MTIFTVKPIFWNNPFPLQSTTGFPSKYKPYDDLEFTEALRFINSTGYFSQLSQYRCSAVEVADDPVTIPEPYPAGDDHYFAVYDYPGVEAFVRKYGSASIDFRASRKDINVIVLPCQAVLDPGAQGAHFSTLTYKDSLPAQQIWAWVSANYDLNDALLSATHEIVEAIGADGGAPKELCDDCQNQYRDGISVASGISVATYFDARTNSCVAPHSFDDAKMSENTRTPVSAVATHRR